MKLIVFLVLFILYSVPVPVAAACTQTSPIEQKCEYQLTWNWEQGTGIMADGYVVQQQVDNNGEWYDIYLPLPVNEKFLLDTINADKGGRNISWRVFAYKTVPITTDFPNGQLRSGPSNTASIVTPAIQNPTALVIKSRPGLEFFVSRRATDTASAVMFLINPDEVLGPEGIEITAPEGITVLPPSRRAISTPNTAVLMLVNKSQIVIVNGQVK